MNQTRIYRLAKIFLEESNQYLAEALEPQVTDRIHQLWSPEEMSLILRAEYSLLEENEKTQLQQALEISFDTSHPEFCKETALANLRRNFSDPVDLCKECLYIKYQEELDEHDRYCADCEPPLQFIFEPEPETIPEEPMEEPVENRPSIVTIDALEELQQ